MKDYSSEFEFQTARSGGKGGQHVNKTETMVMGFWKIDASALLSDQEKTLLLQKLHHRINLQGQLMVKSQLYRSQLSNKQEVIRKIHQLVAQALTPKKARIATRPGKQSREKRLESKKLQSAKKQWRNKKIDKE